MFKDYIKTVKGYKFYDFPNLSSLITECENAGKSSFGGNSSESGSQYFTKTTSFEEALDLMKNTWAEGTADLNSKLNISNSKTKIKSEYDVIGFQASVPRYLQGVPTNMISQKRVATKEKVLTLTKSISYPCRVEADRIIEESAKTVKLVQELESKGYRVNLNIIFISSGLSPDIINSKTNKQCIIKLKIKSAGTRLNVSKMSFPLMHPSMLRRIVFKVMEHDDVTNGSNLSQRNYGYPVNNVDAVKPFLKDNEIFIPALMGNADIFEEEVLKRLEK